MLIAIRRVDKLGRIALPHRFRWRLNIKDLDEFEVFSDGDRIILRRYIPTCCICGGSEDMQEFRGKRICANCMNEIKAL